MAAAATRRCGIWLLPLALLAGACTTTGASRDVALEQVRADLNELRNDSELHGYAPLALGEAERALRAAEQTGSNDTLRHHLVYIADRRIRIARAQAQHEQLQEALQTLERQRNRMLIRAAQMETDQARLEAERARLLSAATAEDAERARLEASSAREDRAASARAAELAREEAEQARILADAQTRQAELARREAELASQAAATLQRQLENIKLRQTEQGVVVTLGDVLFETGEAELKPGAAESLDEVVQLLESEPQKAVRIEGHTDSRGSAAFNLQLSQRRAASVRDALLARGVAGERLTAVGLGEDFPVASNEDEDGRARNRRVDVILLDGS